jgi:hypothetical protein
MSGHYKTYLGWANVWHFAFALSEKREEEGEEDFCQQLGLRPTLHLESGPMFNPNPMLNIITLYWPQG